MSRPLRPLTVGLSAGEPAGIGPDLCLMLAQQPLPYRMVVAADRDLLGARARQLGLTYPFEEVEGTAAGASAGFPEPVKLFESARSYGSPGLPAPPGFPESALAGPRYRPLLWHFPTAKPVLPGRPDPANSRYVLDCLDALSDSCRSGTLDALVTAPVQKSVIEDAGIRFTGHTEYLAQRLGAVQVVMMLVGGGLRVALTTTHLPLSAVAQHITRPHLSKVLEILHHDLRQRFGLPHPRILVAGLNPHAGESGHLGREEIEVIEPVLATARARGWAVEGPFPADTLFTPQRLQGADAVLVQYHDQGLPVLKHVSFGQGVNVTLGLPIIRTSVDHGTALERAATGLVALGSLQAALELARELAVRAAQTIHAAGAAAPSLSRAP